MSLLPPPSPPPLPPRAFAAPLPAAPTLVSVKQVDKVTSKGLAPILVAFLLFFGGLLAEQPVLMGLGLVVFIGGLIFRSLAMRRTLASQPPVEKLQITKAIKSRKNARAIAVLVSFTGFAVRMFVLKH